MRALATLGIMLVFTFAESGILAHGQSSSADIKALELSSSDGHHVTLTTSAIESLPRTTVRVHNPHTGADETYQGVELSLLLARLDAPLGAKLHAKALAMYVLAEGVDHYRVVYSLAEVDPAFHPGRVIVADHMDGHPLDAKSGPFKLVSTEDKRPARFVRNLVSIQLKSAPE